MAKAEEATIEQSADEAPVERVKREGPAPRIDEGPLADTNTTTADPVPQMKGIEALATQRPPRHSTAGAPALHSLQDLSQFEIAPGKTYEDGTPVERGERDRWGGRRYRLPQLDPRPGFKQHVFNDVPGRIEGAKKRGYRHRVDREGMPIKVVVDRNTGAEGYLMEIPIEFWFEDFADKQQIADKVDATMLRKDPYTGQPLTRMHVTKGREPE